LSCLDFTGIQELHVVYPCGREGTIPDAEGNADRLSCSPGEPDSSRLVAKDGSPRLSLDDAKGQLAFSATVRQDDEDAKERAEDRERRGGSGTDVADQTPDVEPQDVSGVRLDLVAKNEIADIGHNQFFITGFPSE
jgi:hypothetical protein